MPIFSDLPDSEDLSSITAPTWVQGVWQRTWVRTPGNESRQHFVIWIQTPTLYADFRSLEDKSSKTEKLRDEGFAGWLHVEHQVCRWRRPIDLHPGPEDADQGAMYIDGDVMLETGLIRNYQEEFQRIAAPQRCFAASRGAFEITDKRVQFSAKGPLEILVAIGSHVIHACRADHSALRYGHYDEQTEQTKFTQLVGDVAAFAKRDGTWTIWTPDAQRQGSLLNATDHDA